MSSSKVVIVDEYSLLLAEQNQKDRVRHVLRATAGIPNAAYLVSKTRVFVFEKLVKLVMDSGLDPAKETIGVLNLVPLAWVCPEEAVRQWAVQPVGYRLETIGQSKAWQIRHEAFGAIIPQSYLSIHSARTAMAQVLMGEAVSEGGNLDYAGQPLLMQPAQLPLLTEKPDLHLPATTGTPAHKASRRDKWSPGHSLIDQATFDETQALDISWRQQMGQFEEFVQANYVRLQGIVSTLSLHVDRDMPHPLDADEVKEAQTLVGMYPELKGLSPSWLWHKFGDFCETIGFRSMVLIHDDRFIAYLLGRIGAPECGQYAAEEVGLSVAYYLLQGCDLAKACQQAKVIHDYSVALSARTMYIQRVMAHLVHEQDRELRRKAIQAGRPIHEIGKEIYTLHDLLSVGRKIGTTSLRVTQKPFSRASVG